MLVIDRGAAGALNDRVDVAIRLIKEVARSIYSHVQQQYPVPPQFVSALLKNAAFQLNMYRGRSNRPCPRVEATGIKPFYLKDFGLAFGDYAEVRDHSLAKNNITHGRTQGCIALHPTCNSHGSWLFWHLLTGKTIISSDWNYVPTPDIVIKQLRDMAATEPDQMRHSLTQLPTPAVPKKNAVVQQLQNNRWFQSHLHPRNHFVPHLNRIN